MPNLSEKELRADQGAELGLVVAVLDLDHDLFERVLFPFVVSHL